MATILKDCPGWHLSMTNSNRRKLNTLEYVTKSETRIDGPWSSSPIREIKKKDCVVNGFGAIPRENGLGNIKSLRLSILIRNK